MSNLKESLIDYLPQEILLEISSYGQIVPGLTPEYINTFVTSISPQWLWFPEMKIEAMRRDNKFYTIMRPILNYCKDKNLKVWPDWIKSHIVISNIQDDEVREVFRSISMRLDLVGLTITEIGLNQFIIQSNVQDNDILMCPWIHSPRYMPQSHKPESTLISNNGWKEMISSINSESTTSCNIESLRELIDINTMYNLGETLALIHNYTSYLQIVQCIPEYSEVISWLCCNNTSVSIQSDRELVIITSSIGEVSDYFKGRYYIRIIPISSDRVKLIVHIRSRLEFMNISSMILEIQACIGRLVARSDQPEPCNIRVSKCSLM